VVPGAITGSLIEFDLRHGSCIGWDVSSGHFEIGSL